MKWNGNKSVWRNKGGARKQLKIGSISMILAYAPGKANINNKKCKHNLFQVHTIKVKRTRKKRGVRVKIGISPAYDLADAKRTRLILHFIPVTLNLIWAHFFPSLPMNAGYLSLDYDFILLLNCCEGWIDKRSTLRTMRLCETFPMNTNALQRTLHVIDN